MPWCIIEPCSTERKQIDNTIHHSVYWTQGGERQTATATAGRQYTEEGDILTVSDAQKRARKKWNDANMKRFAVDLRNEVFEEVEQERKKRDMSRADVIIDWLKSHK